MVLTTAAAGRGGAEAGAFVLYEPLLTKAAIRSKSCLSIPRVLYPAPWAMALNSEIFFLPEVAVD